MVGLSAVGRSEGARGNHLLASEEPYCVPTLCLLCAYCVTCMYLLCTVSLPTVYFLSTFGLEQRRRHIACIPAKNHSYTIYCALHPVAERPGQM